jgi:hypothetical protein
MNTEAVLQLRREKQFPPGMVAINTRNLTVRDLDLVLSFKDNEPKASGLAVQSGSDFSLDI